MTIPCSAPASRPYCAPSRASAAWAPPSTARRCGRCCGARGPTSSCSTAVWATRTASSSAGRCAPSPRRRPSCSTPPTTVRPSARGAPRQARPPSSTRRSTSTSSSTRSGWPGGGRSRRTALSRSARQELPEHVLQDPAVAEVLRLLGRVDPHAGGELAVSGADRHLARQLAAVQAVGQAGDGDLLLAREVDVLVALQREHAHADEVRAVNALEALGDHGADAEQVGALGRPVARRARPVLLAPEHDERRALLGVLHRRVVDRHLLALGQLARDASLRKRIPPAPELVAQPDVGERAADHHLVIAATRPV